MISSLKLLDSRRDSDMARKLTKMDKMILEITNTNSYNLYVCPVHGMYSKRKDVDTDGSCPRSDCTKGGKRYEPKE